MDLRRNNSVLATPLYTLEVFIVYHVTSLSACALVSIGLMGFPALYQKGVFKTSTVRAQIRINRVFSVRLF